MKIKIQLMMQKIEIKEFLRTGNVNESKEIRFGITRNKLVEVLGDSQHQYFSSKKLKFPAIYKYGKVEFYFETGIKGKLYGIQILPTIQEEDLININYSLINSNLDYRSALNYLESEFINYKLIKSKFDSEDVVRIETEGKVQLIFLKDFNEDIIIQKVHKFVKLDGLSLQT